MENTYNQKAFNKASLQAEFFVASDGSDERGDGTLTNPYATVGAAQSAIRTLIKDGGLRGDVRILVRGGTYYLREPIVIGVDDYDPVYRVIYSNYKDETVRFVGGVPVSGWHDDDGDGIFEADVTGFPAIYAMYCDGVWLPNAREQNWKNKAVRDPSHLQAVCGSNTSWFGEVLKIHELNGEQITTDYPKCAWSGRIRYLQGAREYIDEAGEWAMEGSTLYYMPAEPEKIAECEIVVGTADHIFLVEGVEGQPVKNIVIRGFHLEMNAFGENLVAHARPNDVIGEYDTNLTGLVCLHNAEAVTVERCRMTNAGYMAVVLKGYCQHNMVYGNQIQDTGYAGMFLIGENPGSLNYCNKYNTISNNRIYNVGNFVGHGSGIYLMNSGENRIVHNDISNVPRYGISMKGVCYEHFPANGMVDVPFEDHWKYNQTTGNYIAYNRIYNTGMRSGDGGGIEGWGIGRDNHIDHNVVYNAYRGVHTKDWRGHSIFLDDATHHTKVTYNIVYDENAVTVNAGTMIKSIDNYVVNNIFDVSYAKSGAADIGPYVCPAGGSVFKHNIVYANAHGTLLDDGRMIEEGPGDRIMLYFAGEKNPAGIPSLMSLREMDENIYFNAVGAAQIRAGDQLLSLDEWQCSEQNVNRYDAHSICADPLFVDAANRDYRLRADSPAYKLGIESIDIDEIGLQIDLDIF